MYDPFLKAYVLLNAIVHFERAVVVKIIHKKEVRVQSIPMQKNNRPQLWKESVCVNPINLSKNFFTQNSEV